MYHVGEVNRLPQPYLMFVSKNSMSYLICGDFRSSQYRSIITETKRGRTPCEVCLKTCCWHSQYSKLYVLINLNKTANSQMTPICSITNHPLNGVEIGLSFVISNLLLTFQFSDLYHISTLTVPQ